MRFVIQLEEKTPERGEDRWLKPIGRGGLRVGRWDWYLDRGRILAYHLTRDRMRIVRWEL